MTFFIAGFPVCGGGGVFVAHMPENMRLHRLDVVEDGAIVQGEEWKCERCSQRFLCNSPRREIPAELDARR